METTTNKPPFAGCLVLKEDESGLWHFVHHPDRKPLSANELQILRNTDTKLILISKPI